MDLLPHAVGTADGDRRPFQGGRPAAPGQPRRLARSRERQHQKEAVTMRIAGHTLGTPEQTVPEALALFATAGLDAAEVIYQDGYRSGLPLRDRRSAEQARRASEDTGISIVGMTPYTTGINTLDQGEWGAAGGGVGGA